MPLVLTTLDRMNILEAAHRRCAALVQSLADRDERLIAADRQYVRLEQVADAKQYRIVELEFAIGIELAKHTDALAAMHVRLTEALSGSEPTPAGSASVDAEPPTPLPPLVAGHRKKKRHRVKSE